MPGFLQLSENIGQRNVFFAFYCVFRCFDAPPALPPLSLRRFSRQLSALPYASFAVIAGLLIDIIAYYFHYFRQYFSFLSFIS
jgi:hypothetical protein